GKFYIFLAAIDAGLYVLAVIGVLTSVVGTFYYLRIVKVMYFDDLEEPLDNPIPRGIGVVLAGTGLFILLFFSYPVPLLSGAARAAASLFGG
ncbi:MAG: NADH-quinone oxidoreductase subunit N, partial [Rhodospirillales bacterium]